MFFFLHIETEIQTELHKETEIRTELNCISSLCPPPPPQIQIFLATPLPFTNSIEEGTETRGRREKKEGRGEKMIPSKGHQLCLYRCSRPLKLLNQQLFSTVMSSPSTSTTQLGEENKPHLHT